ncbi:MAG: heme exporter protein CcmB [Bradymonadaceae bacterium]
MKSGIPHQIATLILKDLRRELRTLEIITTTVAFSILLLVIFTFAFYQHDDTARLVFPGILWVAIIFAGTLAISRTFAQEKEGGCLRALALVPGTHLSLYYSKLVVSMIFLIVFELVLVPFLALSFNVNILDQLGAYTITILAGSIGFVALGTLLAAMLVHSHLREVLLPILLYPLLVPLLIVGVKITGALFDGATLSELRGWLQLLIAMDIAYIFMGQFLFRWVLSAIE